MRQRYSYAVILLRQLVKTDFKLRYQGSLLGYLWSLLRPLLLFVILYLVFTVFLPVGKGVPHYPVYLLLGIVIWNYFTEVTTGSVASIASKGDLLRKVNFPRYVIILSGSSAALINLSLNAIVIAIFMLLGHVPITWHALILIPLAIELFVVSLGMAFFLSTLFVRFRDVSYIWDVIMQGAFYATPILYPLSKVAKVHKGIAKIMILNPMAQIIQDARHALVTKQTLTISQLYGKDYFIWFIPVSISIVVLITGAFYFRKRSKFFAEEV
jgi:ABC-2 type transport system permease protein